MLGVGSLSAALRSRHTVVANLLLEFRNARLSSGGGRHRRVISGGLASSHKVPPGEARLTVWTH